MSRYNDYIKVIIGHSTLFFALIHITDDIFTNNLNDVVKICNSGPFAGIKTGVGYKGINGMINYNK